MKHANITDVTTEFIITFFGIASVILGILIPRHHTVMSYVVYAG